MTLSTELRPANSNSMVWLRSLGMLSLVIWAALAWAMSSQISQNRSFVLDDSYITYTYARELAQGNGLRYNSDDLDPTEGASSLLHTWSVAMGIKAGIDPLTFTRGLNLIVLFAAAGGVVLALTRGFGLRPDASMLAASIILSLVAFLPETQAHMASGMESVLMLGANMALFSWAITVTLRPASLGRVSAFVGGVLSVVVFLMRPEGFILAGSTLAIVGFARWKITSRRSLAHEIQSLLPPILIFSMAVAALFLWKFSYFGDIVPNAYWVKSHNRIFGTAGNHLPGLKQVVGFLAVRWLPMAILAIWLFWVNRHKNSETLALFILLVPSVIVLAAYTMVIHEAAGSFRYGYPLIAPLLVVMGLALARKFQQGAGPAIAAIVVATYLIPALATPKDSSAFKWLNHPITSATNWIGNTPVSGGIQSAALDLRDTGLGNNVTVLLSAAGIIPWYSKFHAIDWIGLNNNTLSGKYPLSIDEVWEYINAQGPDVVVSFVPPASAGATSYKTDPAFNTKPIQNPLRGQGTKLFRNWDQDRISEMLWREMAWIRDNTVFGACYNLDGDWAVIIYITKESEHFDKIADSLATSERTSCDRGDLGELYYNDPRLQGMEE